MQSTSPDNSIKTTTNSLPSAVEQSNSYYATANSVTTAVGGPSNSCVLSDYDNNNNREVIYKYIRKSIENIFLHVT